MRRYTLLSLVVLLSCVPRSGHTADPYAAGNDPYWILLHEPAVVEELQFAPDQQQEYRRFLDGLDLRYFPLRNKRPDEAVSGMAGITNEARRRLETLLRPSQRQRLSEILLRQLGNRAFLDAEVTSALRYSDVQTKRIREIMDDTESSLAELRQKNGDAIGGEAFQKKHRELKTAEQKRILELLKPEQRTTLRKLVGAPFEPTRLGRPAFKAPELVDTGEWINSPPQRLERLRGKVVVLHFYASGCINCIHNFPSYREWHAKFHDRDVVQIGIHTPETASEREVANVRRRAADERLEFPILIDGKNENWNAWGNSLWPSVYLIDRQGYLRYFWPGELKWQGTDGERYMRGRIEELLAERVEPAAPPATVTAPRRR